MLIVFAAAGPRRATEQRQIGPAYVIANNRAVIAQGGRDLQNIIIPEAVKHSILNSEPVTEGMFAKFLLSATIPVLFLAY